MPETLNSPANALNAVDYFKAKLQFEGFPHQVHGIMNNGTTMLVDVRPKDAYAKEHIKGAVNIPFDELPKRLRELPKDKTIVTYCWNVTCPIAAKAALELAHKDYKVQELFGGIQAWREAGFEVEASGAGKA